MLLSLNSMGFFCRGFGEKLLLFRFMVRILFDRIADERSDGTSNNSAYGAGYNGAKNRTRRTPSGNFFRYANI